MKSWIAAIVMAGMPMLVSAAEKPLGRFLFQPMLIWATGQATHQGTGYILADGGRYYGVTSVHFLNFAAGGLHEAIWLDIPSFRPVVTFTSSIGKPERKEIRTFGDIAHDFILMPLGALPPGCSAVEAEDMASYPPKTKLWFPNKTEKEKDGYEWIEAEILEDAGNVIKVKLLSPIALQSQSGSPFLNQETGRVVGMLMGGDDKEIYLCPARSIAKRLKEAPAPVPLMESVR